MQNDLNSSLVKLVNFSMKKINKDDLNEVNKDGVKLVDKVSGIIDLDKINNSKYILNNSKYDTYKMIDDLKYLYTLEKDNKKITITTEVSDQLNNILYGDSEKVKQASLYLFSYLINIIKTGDIKELLLLFRPYGCHIDVAMNEQQIKEELSSNKTYDLVIVDDIIPNYSIDKESKKLENTKKTIKSYAGYGVKIIIMVTENKKDLELEYKKIGFEDCITKPMNKANINQMVLKNLKDN